MQNLQKMLSKICGGRFQDLLVKNKFNYKSKSKDKNYTPTYQTNQINTPKSSFTFQDERKN